MDFRLMYAEYKISIRQNQQALYSDHIYIEETPLFTSYLSEQTQSC